MEGAVKLTPKRESGNDDRRSSLLNNYMLPTALAAFSASTAVGESSADPLYSGEMP